MARPLITLTTDFGTADHYAGVIKGVIKRIAPAAEILDISHDLTPFEIVEAAHAVGEISRYYPKKTIHVVVVDPGVGTARRPILMEAAGQYFVAPDNGVLTMAAKREPKHKAREITASKYFLQPVSRTFHGRDIFAPCAAHLAMGASPASFGKLITDHLKLKMDSPTRTGKRTWQGVILRVDRFGNMITNFHIDEFDWVTTHPFELAVGMEKIRRLALNYAECNIGDVALIVGSSGYLEVSSNQASAAKILGCGSGAPAELTVW